MVNNEFFWNYIAHGSVTGITIVALLYGILFWYLPITFNYLKYLGLFNSKIKVILHFKFSELTSVISQILLIVHRIRNLILEKMVCPLSYTWIIIAFTVYDILVFYPFLSCAGFLSLYMTAWTLYWYHFPMWLMKGKSS